MKKEILQNVIRLPAFRHQTSVGEMVHQVYIDSYRCIDAISISVETHRSGKCLVVKFREAIAGRVLLRPPQHGGFSIKCTISRFHKWCNNHMRRNNTVYHSPLGRTAVLHFVVLPDGVHQSVQLLIRV